MRHWSVLIVLALASFWLSGCATQTSRTLPVSAVQTAAAPYAGPRLGISVGRFDNRSGYLQGAFSDGTDRLGSQAMTTLIAHLHQSQRFSVLDRENLAQTRQEAALQGKQQQLRGAAFVITGAIAEFGRKQSGDQQLFGILGRGKTQVAYAKVTLNVVDTLTGAVVYSSSGAGEYEVANREVLGTGGTAGYDATLNGKVLDLAIREAVQSLVAGRDAGQWGTETSQ